MRLVPGRETSANAGVRASSAVGVFAGENGYSCLFVGEAMEDLSKKQCQCGATLGEVIGYDWRSTDQQHVPYRAGWYCPDCKTWEKAIARERLLKR